MAANQSVVDAYVRIYSEEQITTALTQALADHAAGVQITQVSFEGGNASGRPISGDPSYLVEILETALKQIDDTTLKNQPQSGFMDLSKRSFGT